MCKKENVNIILDIGTSNGLGTTKCIVDAILDSNKTFYKIYSLECRLDRVMKAIDNLSNITNLYLLHGTIVNSIELEPLLKNLDWGYMLNSIWVSASENISTALSWLKEDMHYLKTTPNVMSKIPEKLDLLVIDGSEFTGFIEFKKMFKNSRYIALDDVNSFKNRKSREFVINNVKEFKILVDSEKDNCFVCENLLFKA